MDIEEISRTRPKARRHHRCFHCGGWIVPGEYHDKGTFKADDIYTLRIHDDCAALWDTYFSDAKLPFGDYCDGIPPLREDWSNSGEFQNLCDAYRGRFPGPVTRMERHEQIAKQRYTDRIDALRKEGSDA